jgi:ABC-type amino acid transport substrate-binding protein
MADAWPVEVPTSLWTYQSLALKSTPDVPMMGLSFANGFLVSVGVGALFLLVFARRRFMEARRDVPGAERFLVLSELCPQDLGGANALRKAYLIYAIVILILYLSLTFFGKLIFSLSNQLPVAGINVDTDRIEFNQPIWPLTVAFGLAGFAPLLAPVQIAEDWLRERAYRAVGIPTRIQTTTGKIIAALDHATTPMPTNPRARRRWLRRDKRFLERERPLREMLAAKRIAMERALEGSELLRALGRRDRLSEFLSLHVQLEALIYWARGARGAWPGIEVSEAVRTLERRTLEEAEELLNMLSKSLSPDRKDRARQPIAEEIVATLRRMRRLRGDLASIVAVLVERDPVETDKEVDQRGRTVSEIRDRALDSLLVASEPNPVSAGPELGLGLSILGLIPVYAALVWIGLYSPFAPAASPQAPATILTSAALEALRQTMILWLPVMAAFSVRQYLIDEERWIYDLGRHSYATEALRERGAAIAVALVVGFLGLVALAPLWAFLQAPSQPRFYDLLMGGSVPFLRFYPSMVLITLPAVWSALAGADARASGHWWRCLIHGLLGAALVFLAQYIHLGLWYGFQACTSNGWFLFDVWRQDDCALNYGIIDYLVYPMLTFLTAVFFGNPEKRTRRQLRRRARESLRPALVVLTLLAVLPWHPAGPARADGIETGPPQPSEETAATPAGEHVWKLGFRADAEPFSALAQPTEGGRKYTGYVADLCYHIFANLPVEEVEVRVDDRFSLLDDGKIDVLCDPVTMRLSDPERKGLYSPIIFASGVSYLRVLQRSLGARAQITFVEGTTTEAVARRACESDLFGIVQPSDRGNLPLLCDTSWWASQYAYASDRELPNAQVLKKVRDVAALQLRWANSDRHEPGLVPAACGRWAGENCVRGVEARMQEITEELDLLAKNLPEDDPASLALIPGALARIQAARKSLEATVGVKDGNRIFDILQREIVWKDIGERLSDPACGAGPCAKGVIKELVYLGNNPRCPILDNSDSTRWEKVFYRFCPKPSHDEAISWLCSKRFAAQSNLVYMGDRDIIVGKFRAWNKRNPPCEVESADGTDNLTYEPYALLFTPNAKLARIVQRGVYDFFSHRTLATATFETHFPDKTMSTPLAYLFLLNAVAREEELTSQSRPIPIVTPPG